MADACQKFEEIAMDKELLMTVRDIQNGYCNIDLLEMGENNQVLLDVAKTLISSGLVKPGKDEKKGNMSHFLMNSTNKKIHNCLVFFNEIKHPGVWCFH